MIELFAPPPNLSVQRTHQGCEPHPGEVPVGDGRTEKSASVRFLGPLGTYSGRSHYLER
jgi:hypothetical protein